MGSANVLFYEKAHEPQMAAVRLVICVAPYEAIEGALVEGNGAQRTSRIREGVDRPLPVLLACKALVIMWAPENVGWFKVPVESQQ